MERAFLAVLAWASLSGTALAQAQLPLDAPIPSDFKERLFLPSAAVAGVRDKMERVVGYWGFIRNGVIQVSSGRPASFTTVPALTKVTLASGKPTYEGVLSRSNELSVAIPVIGVSWASNQKGQVTITDSAQFVAGGDPTDTDWGNLPAASNGGRWVFIDSATVSVVQTSVLSEKSGGITALIKALNIGGKNYQAMSGTTSTLIVSLFVKENPLTLAGGQPPAKPKTADLSFTDRSFSALASQ